MNKKYNKFIKLNQHEIGERVKGIRSEESQREFASRFGLTQVDISRIEKGEVKPALEVLFNICIAYEKNLYWLITGKESYNEKLETPSQDILEIIDWLDKNPEAVDVFKKLISGSKQVVEAIKTIKDISLSGIPINNA